MDNSAIYEGWVRHRRYAPLSHQLQYRVFMVLLDLDETETLMQQHPLWRCRAGGFALARFCRSDFYAAKEAAENTAADLKARVIQAFDQQLDEQISSVRLLTNLRYFGFIMNPVSFYFGYRQDGSLAGILAEITNTPWRERFHYLLSTRQQSKGIAATAVYPRRHTSRYRYRFAKRFHVSPFNPMNMEYHWLLNEPGDGLLIHMETLNNSNGGHRDFDATLSLSRRPFSRSIMSSVLWQYPFMTMKVWWGIYWNALRLWLRRCRFYDHPHSRQQDTHTSARPGKERNHEKPDTDA
ncbi:MAG: DUF1365 domain-containing protein [Pseudomonadota bacterium]|nr:DUF1365 domain-containing protein [Pseudomonadota bacterium]